MGLVGKHTDDHGDVDVLGGEPPATADPARLEAHRLADQLRAQAEGRPPPHAAVDDGDRIGADLVDQLQLLFPGAVVRLGDPGPLAGSPQVNVITGPPGGDPVERLEKLARLRDRGVVDQGQFEQLRAQVLAEAGID
jgi:hypothetical protein